MSATAPSTRVSGNDNHKPIKAGGKLKSFDDELKDDHNVLLAREREEHERAMEKAKVEKSLGSNGYHRSLRTSYFASRGFFLRSLSVIFFIAFLSFLLQSGGLVGDNGILPAKEFLGRVEQKYGSENAFDVLPTAAWLGRHPIRIAISEETMATVKKNIPRFHRDFFSSLSTSMAPYFANVNTEWISGVTEHFSFVHLSDKELVIAPTVEQSIRMVCALGLLFSILSLVYPFAVFYLLMWFSYLSLVNVGQVFYGFQWDSLLLEAGFLAVFVAPILSRRETPSYVVVLMQRWLLFRLMFASGAVKLNDSWSDLGAMKVHYLTTCIPNPLSWFAHHLPAWFHEAEVFATIFVELLLPIFTVFGGRKARAIGFFSFVALQVVIATTGNYTFFNLLSAALCIPLLDDLHLTRLLPSSLLLWFADGGLVRTRATIKKKRRNKNNNGRNKNNNGRNKNNGRNNNGDVVAKAFGPVLTLTVDSLPKQRRRSGAVFGAYNFVRLVVLAGLMALLFTVSVVPFSNLLKQNTLPSAITDLHAKANHLNIVNSYGLFSHMTKERFEIEVQGSMDGKTWKPYGFVYKPGPLNRMPPLVAPYQPRLDWQMWFAALTTPERAPWFNKFLAKLLVNEPSVLALIETNPFAPNGPNHIRAMKFEYKFTAPLSKEAKAGNWWKRGKAQEYAKAISKKKAV
eukprot:TRINITY_DN45_c0_g1_i1.p1 TRINITY_DN45_c0_g1~~TRINITY_DN45_c0_g1_i1.p1  ORF type:complete len:684 (+),score=142.85 TRINITY_DN45_c0_g1_i1:46-2097(+)